MCIFFFFSRVFYRYRRYENIVVKAVELIMKIRLKTRENRRMAQKVHPRMKGRQIGIRRE